MFRPETAARARCIAKATAEPGAVVLWIRGLPFGVGTATAGFGAAVVDEVGVSHTTS